MDYEFFTLVQKSLSEITGNKELDNLSRRDKYCLLIDQMLNFYPDILSVDFVRDYEPIEINYFGSKHNIAGRPSGTITIKVG